MARQIDFCDFSEIAIHILMHSELILCYVPRNVIYRWDLNNRHAM